MPDGMVEVQQEHQRVVVFLVDLVPDQRSKSLGKICQRRAFPIPGPCLQDGQAVFQRLLQQPRHPWTGERMDIAGWGDDLGAQNRCQHALIIPWLEMEIMKIVTAVQMNSPIWGLYRLCQTGKINT